ncbi:hypothetical protein pb186bvf_010462 [Paramecium bursaria]
MYVTIEKAENDIMSTKQHQIQQHRTQNRVVMVRAINKQIPSNSFRDENFEENYIFLKRIGLKEEKYLTALINNNQSNNNIISSLQQNGKYDGERLKQAISESIEISLGHARNKYKKSLVLMINTELTAIIVICNPNDQISLCSSLIFDYYFHIDLSF